MAGANNHPTRVQKVKDIKTPKGTHDFANEQMPVRERVFLIISNVFKRHGATELDTSVFELRETLTGNYGEDSKLIYDLADQGGELLSLRYDLTVPFAKYVAINGLKSFKRFQMDKVYRRDNTSRGRFREFYQCDFDIAGEGTISADSEVIMVLTEVLNELNIGDYKIKLNHRKLLDGMLEICGVPQEKFRTICSSIDKLDKKSLKQVKKEMVDEKGLDEETANKIGYFVMQRGEPLKLLGELTKEGSKFLGNLASSDALKDLEKLFDLLNSARCLDKVVLDLSLARGLDYYTGVIYEAVLEGETQVGSIAAGGRYDNLIEKFGSQKVPAVGVSLGIERIFTIMKEKLQKDPNQVVRATETEVLVVDEDISLAVELACQCWDADLKAEVMVHKRKAFDRAKKSLIPWMVIVGDRECEEGYVQLKDTFPNKYENVPITSVVDELIKRIHNGTRDITKEPTAARERAFFITRKVFKKHGATVLDTPLFELKETLTGKYGEDSNLIYDLADQGGELCSLRYDLTVPFARYVATNRLTSFKRYQIGKVYRIDNLLRCRCREFYQCDFDIAGDETLVADFEVIRILTEVLNELNIGDYEIKLNHRKLLDGMLEIYGVPQEKFRTICSSINKLDKQSLKGEMVDKKGLDEVTADKIGSFVRRRGEPLKLLGELKEDSDFLGNFTASDALKDLEKLFDLLKIGKCLDKVVLDLSLAGGLDYYTGVIFEAVFKGETQVGSIASGGRYDNLIEKFSCIKNYKVTAVGVSLQIERIITIMEEKLKKDPNQAVRMSL